MVRGFSSYWCPHCNNNRWAVFVKALVKAQRVRFQCRYCGFVREFGEGGNVAV